MLTLHFNSLLTSCVIYVGEDLMTSRKIILIALFWQSNLVMAQGGDRRRHPQNLQGVLRLAVEAGSASEGPAPNEPMSEEVNE